MTRQTELLAAVALIAISAACERADDRQVLETPPTVLGDHNLVRPRPVIVEGCLTASGDRFVLTQLERGVPEPQAGDRRDNPPEGSAEPTTEAYRLVGLEDQLRPHVNQRVEITGEAEPEHVAELRRVSPPLDPRGQEPTGTSGRDPQVSTVETARIEISDLLVRSVEAEGEPCHPAN